MMAQSLLSGAGGSVHHSILGRSQNRVQLCIGRLWLNSIEGLSKLSIEQPMTAHCLSSIVHPCSPPSDFLLSVVIPPTGVLPFSIR
jgi:hypothetical protein